MTTMIATVSVLADTDFGHMGDWGAGWWVLMMVGMVLFWGGIILVIAWVVRELSGRRAHDDGKLGALDLLDRRLAEGQISTEEYEERRRVLKGESRPGDC